MKDRKKLIVAVLALLAVAATYKLAFAGSPDANARIHGQVYVLPKEFLLNLADSHFVKLNVGLVLAEGQVPEESHGGPPPEGFGALEQEAVVRDVITDTITDSSSDELVSRKGRTALKEKILKRLRAETDVKVNDVLFTDVAVQ